MNRESAYSTDFDIAFCSIDTSVVFLNQTLTFQVPHPIEPETPIGSKLGALVFL
jgi:hypothetical protein